MRYFLQSLIAVSLLTVATRDLKAQNWASLDAVVYNDKTDKYYFFFGKYFVIKERGQYIDGLPLLIAEEWDNFPKSWNGGNLDAVCYSADNDKFYFFKGDEYCETTVTKVATPAGSFKIPNQTLSKPAKINSEKGFKGLNFPRIDAAVYNSITNTYYFFYGNEYMTKKRGEPVSPKIFQIDLPGGFVNLPKERPIKAVTFSSDNKEYYFFWDDFYITKTMGKDIEPGTAPRRYENDGQKGFEWAERSNDNFVGLANESGYLANFKVTWKVDGKEDSWSKKAAALTYEKRLRLPKKATDITIAAYTYDLIEDGNGEKVFSESMSIPPNKWYKVYGTVFKPAYKKDKKSSNIMGSVATFFTRDLANAVSDAGEFFEEVMHEAEYLAVKELAKADAKKRLAFIENFGKSASAVVADKSFIESLYRVAKAKDSKVAEDAMRALVNRPEFDEVRKALEFKTMSIGFTAGASTVIGIEGSFGYGVSMDGKKVKGYAGLDASLGIQEGLGLGCQFGIWKNTPEKLSGNSVAVNVEVGAGVGVSFSVVYDVALDKNNLPVFTFSGIVVTPGIGAGIGASVGTGYSWVY